MRTAASPTALTAAVREAVRQTDSNLPIIDFSTQAETIDRLLAQERIIAQLAGFIALLALLLACTGLFGLLSHEVGARTREIGIRMALGARRPDVLRLVLRMGLLVATFGLALWRRGAAFAVTRYLKGDSLRCATGRPGHVPGGGCAAAGALPCSPAIFPRAAPQP